MMKQNEANQLLYLVGSFHAENHGRARINLSYFFPLAARNRIMCIMEFIIISLSLSLYIYIHIHTYIHY